MSIEKESSGNTTNHVSLPKTNSQNILPKSDLVEIDDDDDVLDCMFNL